MPRNKSEKRSTLEQEVYDYVKAWVEFSCLPDGSLKFGFRLVNYSMNDSGGRHWRRISDKARCRLSGIDANHRWEWLRAQKQK